MRFTKIELGKESDDLTARVKAVIKQAKKYLTGYKAQTNLPI